MITLILHCILNHIVTVNFLTVLKLSYRKDPWQWITPYYSYFHSVAQNESYFLSQPGHSLALSLYNHNAHGITIQFCKYLPSKWKVALFRSLLRIILLILLELLDSVHVWKKTLHRSRAAIYIRVHVFSNYTHKWVNQWP